MDDAAVSKKTWNWKERMPNNILTIPAGLDTGFFKWWCIYMRPIVSLTDREVEIMACFLKHHYELSKVVKDPAILDSMLMGPDTRNKIIEECNITQQHFYVLMSNLRKNNVITSTGINPRLIPNIRENDEAFQFLILFKDKK